MNLYFVRGSGTDARLITPRLTGTLLPGITRDSLLTLAFDLGHTRRGVTDLVGGLAPGLRGRLHRIH